MSNHAIFGVFLQKNAITVGRLKNGSLCYRDGASKVLSTKILLKRYIDSRPFLEGWEYLDEAEIDQYMIDNAPPEKNNEKEERIPPMTFIANWLAEHSNLWRVSPTGKRITFMGADMPVDKDMSDLITEILVDVYSNNLPYRDGEITKTVESFFMHRYSNGLAEMFSGIVHDPKYDKAADRWLKKLYEFFKPEEEYDIFETLMKHWAWQVKRKMKGLPVVHHIWINFCGAGGIGKTTCLKKMCAPMEDVTSTTTIAKVFEDTKEMKRLTENYVLIFDELAINVEGEVSEGKLPPDKNNMLKSMLTGEMMDSRIYGSQNQAKKRITFSCISSANTHLYDVIYDSETMRRFAEIKCTATPVDDFTEINKVLDNSIYFWKGIDENRERGYFDPNSDVGRKISAMQASYYPTKSSVYEWLNETHAKAGSGSGARAYKSYRQYCVNCGFKPKAMPNFISDIKHALPDAVRGNTVTIDFSVTPLCLKDSGDDIPSNYGDMKPVEPPTMDKPIVSEFV